MDLNEVYIKDFLRIPIGKKFGYYRNIIPELFVSELIDKLVLRNGVPDELVLASSLGTGGNMARNILLRTNLPLETPAVTIDAQCAGGLEAIRQACFNIKSRQNEYSIIAGGFESNSLAPSRYYAKNDPRFTKEPFATAQFSPTSVSVLKQAELLAEKYSISANEMVDWTIQSFEKSKRISQEYIQPVFDKTTDETLLKKVSIKVLEKAAKGELIGAHNTAHFHDGAAVALLSSKKENVIAKIVGCCTVGLNANESPFGPVKATQKLLDDLNLKPEDIDLFEIGEAFALKPILFKNHFKIADEKINFLGGSLAYGHPFGASGTISLIHLFKSLKMNQKRFGLVSIGAAGGLSTAIIIENLTP